mmetsp:Transcript_27833/g.39102  ORF Transcript_27833/g.39102 Transcript_27833/m.39102 type:complete len:556 (+) Transcript_27833:521-2188(+)
MLMHIFLALFVAVAQASVATEQSRPQTLRSAIEEHLQVTYNTTSLRGASGLLHRKLETCPDFTDQDLFGYDVTPEDVISEIFGDNIVKEVLLDYFNEQIDTAKGSLITSKDDDTFEPICQRLPLKPDECYLSRDTEENFLEEIISRFVPFGEEILAAKLAFETAIGEIVEPIVEPAVAVYEFFIPEGDDLGTCIALNKDMFGIASNPGFPPSAVYDFVNCQAVKAGKPPPLVIQPFIRGFAIGPGDALQFGTSRLGEKFRVYDGYVTYSYTVSGDVWIGFDFLVGLGGLQQAILGSPVCLPNDTNPPAALPKIPDFPQVEIRTSLFVKSDLTEGGELLVLAAIEEIAITKLAVFGVTFGGGLAILRVRSESPECLPSGIFVSGQFKPEIVLGEGLKEWLQLPSLLEVNIQFGVTWVDDKAVPADDFVQSFFLRYNTEFNFLGISGTTELEFQFLNTGEFNRRKNFDAEICCGPESELGIEDCEIPNSSLEAVFQRPDITPGPTIGAFLKIEDLDFFRSKFFCLEPIMPFVTISAALTPPSLTPVFVLFYCQSCCL